MTYTPCPECSWVLARGINPSVLTFWARGRGKYATLHVSGCRYEGKALPK